MILHQNELEEQLKDFVDCYILCKEVMDMEDVDDDVVQGLFDEYEAAAQRLKEFEKETYGEENPSLPNMEVFFSETGYSAFALRLYSAIMDAKQLAPEEEWCVYSLVYIGELLDERYGNNNEKLEV